jgi:hypothetical protein
MTQSYTGHHGWRMTRVNLPDDLYPYPAVQNENPLFTKNASA